MATPTDKSEPFFPVAGNCTDGYSKDGEATATCFCAAVQLAFPTNGEGYIGSFVCDCADCRKLTASLFASNFTIADTHLKHVRGRENMTTFLMTRSIARQGNSMTNYFCKTCGTLMYRKGSGFPGLSILRIGTVDDFNLAETKLKPTREDFTRTRASWFNGMEGVKHFEGIPEYTYSGL